MSSSMGLEISEIRFSALENHRTLGAEYYSPEFLVPYQILVGSPFKKTKLADCCPLITDGDHGSAEYSSEGVRFVLSEAVERGYVRPEACRYITERHAKSLKRSQLQVGDVLVTKTGAYFGKSAVVNEEFAGANTIAHVGILRPLSSINSYFLSTFLNCKFGQVQLRRRGIKATRPEIKLIEFDDIVVPEVSEDFACAIEKRVMLAVHALDSVNQLQLAADRSLRHALGLDEWSPEEPQSYVRTASDVFNARRLDAEFFAPRVESLLAKLGTSGLTIRDVAPQRRERFAPADEGSFDYIEISEVRSDGTVGSVQVPQNEAPSRATSIVHAGDVVSSTVRPIRRLSAVIGMDQDGFVCSSGFIVLQPLHVPAEVLLTYLRLPLVCELMDLHTSASLYPAISETDLLSLPYHPIPDNAEKEIIAAVRAAHASRTKVENLLRSAEQAVEIAIEHGEEKAMQFLLLSREG